MNLHILSLHYFTVHSTKTVFRLFWLWPLAPEGQRSAHTGARSPLGLWQHPGGDSINNGTLSCQGWGELGRPSMSAQLWLLTAQHKAYTHAHTLGTHHHHFAKRERESEVKRFGNNTLDERMKRIWEDDKNKKYINFLRKSKRCAVFF